MPPLCKQRNLFILRTMLQCGKTAGGPGAQLAEGLMYATGPPNGFFSRRIRLAPVHLLGFNLNKVA
jgi:hypothetical protein